MQQGMYMVLIDTHCTTKETGGSKRVTGRLPVVPLLACLLSLYMLPLQSATYARWIKAHCANGTNNTSTTRKPCTRSTHLAQSVSLGKRLVRSVLKLFGHIARPPSVWVVVNFRQSKMECYLSIFNLFGYIARPPALWVVVNVRQTKMKRILSSHFATLVDDHVPITCL